MKKLLGAIVVLAMAFTIAPAASADPVYSADWKIVGMNMFEMNKTELNYRAKTKLRRIVLQNPNVEFSIVGYAQTIENLDRGYLSKTRALKVKRYLRDLGVSVDIEIKAGWLPDKNSNKDSARRTEIRVKTLPVVGFTMPDLYTNELVGCPSGWQLFTGELSVADEGDPGLLDRLVDMAMYNNLCVDNAGYENPELVDGTYTMFILYYHPNFICTDPMVSDVDVLNGWIQSCSQDGSWGQDYSYYFYTFEYRGGLEIPVPFL